MEDIQHIFEFTIEKELSKHKFNQKELEKAIENFENSLPSLIPKFANVLKKSLAKKTPNMLRERRSDFDKFKKRLYKRWKKPIDMLEEYLVISYETGEQFNNELGSGKSNRTNPKYKVLTSLHARACQVGFEVLELLKSGFSDGAHARWRTLHEVSVVTCFIADNEKGIAEKYLNHEYVESARAANQYKKYYRSLGFKPIQKEELKNFEEKKQLLLKRYGKDFLYDYGWASKILDNSKPKFTDIEKFVGLNFLRPYYRMAGHNVHANAKGANFRLGLSSSNANILLAGASDEGLADPSQCTGLSLLYATSALLSFKTNIDRLVITQVMYDYQSQLAKAFVEVSNKMKSTDA